MRFEPDRNFAVELDSSDPLSGFRDKFFVPDGTIYFDGNSLGLLSKQGLAATEHHEFCGSCHTMDAHLADANDPDSMGLAAIHSRNPKFGDKSCYVCHKDYGMFGYALTKLGGMGHVYYFLTEFAWLDIEEALPKIHIARPFKNENCMQCHTTTGYLWNGVADHRGLLDDLRAGETSCASAGCHGYAHPFSKPDEETPLDAEARTIEALWEPEET